MAYVQVSGVPEALAVLRSYEGVEMERRIRRSTLAGARQLVGPISDATPPHVKTGSPPSDLAGSVAVRVRRDASGFLGYVVGPTGRMAWVKNFVIGGTKPHAIYGKVGKPLGLPWGPRAVIHHPGARANPYVERVGDRYDDFVLGAMARSIARQEAQAGF